MHRFIAALALLVASAVSASAQGSLPTPSLWQGERGGIVKVLRIDPATGNFSGVFISSPTAPCPAVPYELTGQVRRPQRHVVFQTSRTWTSDCAVTTVWSGRPLGAGSVATRWVATSVGPNGQVIKRRGTEVFKRI